MPVPSESVQSESVQSESVQSESVQSESVLVGGETLLVGRYRLDERLSEQDGSSIWKATDEALARPVTVHTFTSASRRAGAAVAAARAAGQLNDPRLVQIFDADDRAEHPYIVSEWPSGMRLDDLVAAGP